TAGSPSPTWPTGSASPWPTCRSSRTAGPGQSASAPSPRCATPSTVNPATWSPCAAAPRTPSPNLRGHANAGGTPPRRDRRPHRLLDLVGQRDEDACGAAEVAEPVAVLVPHQLAEELGPVWPHAVDDVVDVVDGEHDAMHAQRVRRSARVSVSARRR